MLMHTTKIFRLPCNRFSQIWMRISWQNNTSSVIHDYFLAYFQTFFPSSATAVFRWKQTGFISFRFDKLFSNFNRCRNQYKKSATKWDRKTPARATTNYFKLIDKIKYVSIWRIIMTFLWFLSFFVVMRTDRRRSSPSYCKQTGSLVTPQRRVARYKPFKKCHL